MCYQFIVCENNQTVKITPISTLRNSPKTHERIIVPVESSKVEVTSQWPLLTTHRAVESHDKRKATIQRYPPDPTDAPRKSSGSGKKIIVEKFPPDPTDAPKQSDETNKRQAKRKAYDPETHNDLKGNYRIIHNYANAPPLYGQFYHEEINAIQPIQPLHIKTQVFKKKKPVPLAPSKPTKHQKNRLKLEHLPPNPTGVPETTWFDNTGKYSYGIVHGEFEPITEPTEYSKKPGKREGQEADSSNEKIVELSPQKVYKSSFRDPKFVAPATAHANDLGNFLYKSEIHYPSYRNHLYPPVIAYGVNGVHPLQIIHPVPIEPIHTIHPVVTTVYHPNPVHLPKPVHHSKIVPLNKPAHIHTEVRHTTGPDHPAPVVHRKKPHHAQPTHPTPPVHRRKPHSTTPPATTKAQTDSKKEKSEPVEEEEEDDEEEEEEGDEEEDEEEEEEVETKSKEATKDAVKKETGKKQATKQAPEVEEEEYDEQEGDEYEEDGDEEEGDEEEEEDENNASEGEEKPGYATNPKLYNYNYKYVKEPFGKSLELDQFDNAWAKYGYGRNHYGKKSNEEDEEEEGSYESSETRMLPQRVKIHHKKKEKVTKPYNYASGKPRKEKIQQVAGALNHNLPKIPVNTAITTQPSVIQTTTTERTSKDEKASNTPQSTTSTSVKSQDEVQKRSDAPGSDDLKYFQ